MADRFRTITVAKLLEILECESPDAKVIFSTDYGDFGHTPMALPLMGVVDTVSIAPTAYSNSGFMVSEGDDEGASDESFLLLH